MGDAIRDIFSSTNGLAVGVFVAYLIVGAIKGLYKAWRSYEKNKVYSVRAMADQSSIDTQIHELLTEYRLKLSATRLRVIQFHNGEQFYTGSSLQRLSCTHSSEQPGVSVWAFDQNILTSLEAPLIEAMMEDSPRPRCVENMLPGRVRSLKQSQSIIAFAILPIVFNNHMYRGYLLVQWTDQDLVPKTDAAGETLRVCANHISALLAARDNCAPKW